MAVFITAIIILSRLYILSIIMTVYVNVVFQIFFVLHLAPQFKRKYMKRLFFSMMLASAFSAVYSQASFGVHGNGIIANSKETEAEQDLDSKYRFSWKAGLVAQVPLTEQISFMPQLNVLSKGYKVDQSETFDFGGQETTIKVEANAGLTYVELPLNFVYHANASEEGFF